jgi:hypothetical protein
MNKDQGHAEDLVFFEEIREKIVYFLKNLASAALKDHVYVICGCIAWFTDEILLNQLRSMTNYIYIVVNEEDFWSNTGNFKKISHVYKKMYNQETSTDLEMCSPFATNIKNFPKLSWLQNSNTCLYPFNFITTQGNCTHCYKSNTIRTHYQTNCHKSFLKHQRKPLMHTKYLVILQFSKNFKEYRAIAVIHGSFNWSNNANNNLEEVEISTNDYKILKYFDHWQTMISNSLPIWSKYNNYS